jgi:hypothetical protein
MLRRGKFSRSSGQWQDEDYDVLADGKVVGRIYEDGSTSTNVRPLGVWAIAAALNGVAMALAMSVVGLWIITQLRIWRVRQDGAQTPRSTHSFARTASCLKGPIGDLTCQASNILQH